MSLPPDTHLGPYRIVGALGAGGMGEVYRARDTRLERDVAIKVLPAALTNSPTARERFQREARAVAALQHPNICTIFDVGETPDGQAFLVMELLQGETLQRRLENGPLEAVLAIDAGIALTDALDAAHAAGIVHRDIKPANILLTTRGPKMLDFGLAKHGAGRAGQVERAGGAGRAERLPQDRSDIETEALLTNPGSTVGTVAYMSPEQVRGEALDGRTDLFSFGLVLYEMVTGRPAFAAATSGAISAAILHEQPRPPSTIRPDLPPGLEQIILKAIEKDRSLRYQHASDLRADLQRLKRDAGSGRADTRPALAGQPPLAKRWPVVVPVVAAAVAALLAAAYFLSVTSPKLTDKDTIVLADFVNTTGDAVFDTTLRQGLSIQLQQSPFLSLISDERIQGVLRLMAQPANAPLTPAIAREVCERTSSAAVLEGSIANLGTQYVLGLRAKNCRTGDVLDEQQVQAARKEEVLNALSRIAVKFRTRVGESLASITQHDTPLEAATTPSLDALKAYSAGLRRQLSANDVAGAVLLFKRAIEIDPKFASAYAALGFTYGLMGEFDSSIENNSKAYQLRERASDRERFYIAATYDLYVTGNLEKAQQTCEIWMRMYPRELNPPSILGAFVYPTFGQFDKGADVARKTIEINPDFPVGYLQLGFNAQFLGDLAEAEKAFQRASDRKLEMVEFFPTRFDIAFLKADQAGMDREAARARGKPGAEDAIAARQGFVFAYAGRLDDGRKAAQHAVDVAMQAKQSGRAALFQAASALWQAFVGSASAARQDAAAALKLSKDRDLEYGAALALALSGESSRAQTLADDLETRFPEDTEVRFTYVPAIRAQLALNHHEPVKAIELLKAAAPYDLGTPLSAAPAFFGPLYTVYVRGLAYLAARQAPAAAAEFQKILDHRSVVVSDPIGALARLQLGRALAASDETTRAKGAYEDFFALWKNADPDVPILTQAKAEYAALQ